jgi:iron complex transport system ATP-binding protein
MTEVSLLSVDRLTCGYGPEPVLNDITFSLQHGEFAGIIGPNGSGKTTLLRAVSGFLKPITGEVTLNGIPISAVKRKPRARTMATVTQNPEVTLPITVREYVLLGRTPHWQGLRLLETRQDDDIALEAMEMTGVAHLRERSLRELSGGERQLAGLAQALAQQPQVLLLDEITAHLDIGHQVAIMDLLKKLNGEMGLAILLVSHDLSLAAFFCERLLLLDKGELRLQGPPQVVLTEQLIGDVYATNVVVRKTPRHGTPIILSVPSTS